MEQPIGDLALRPTVLVTGGSGFLGSHVVDAFVKTGRYRVVALSRNPTVHCNPLAEYVASDVTKHNDMTAVIEQIQPTIIAHTITPGPFARPYLHNEDFLATRNLVELAVRTASVKAFVYSGSVEVVANSSGACQRPLREEEAILHNFQSAPSAYARAKTCSDAVVLKANGPSLRTVVLHLPGIYGPRDSNVGLNLMKMANTFMTRVQLGNNEVVHDFIYVESAAHAHVLAAEAILRPGNTEHRADGETFFITDGVPTKFWDFARAVWTAAQGDRTRFDKVIVVPWWIVLALATVSEAIYYIFTFGRKTAPLTRLHVRYMKEGAWFSIDKAKERLGYVPLVETEEGIQKTVAWFREHPIAAQQKRA
jgi:sterol-4alpha-carboxylate 3-dehydrogenase (decarboxylating)